MHNYEKIVIHISEMKYHFNILQTDILQRLRKLFNLDTNRNQNI